MARGTSKASPPPTSNASGPLTLTVDCSKGQTIAHALEQGDARKELVVIVRGTCNENVAINRDKVTLQGDPGTGATVNAPNASANAIAVAGADIGIVGLTVTGGSNGISAIGVPGFGVQGSIIQNAAQYGIRVTSSHANIAGNTIQYSGNHGVFFSAANGRVQNNQIRSNAMAGVHLERLSAVAIGGNTITANGSNGVELLSRSYSDLMNNTIASNGTNPAVRRNGVFLNFAYADMGGNSITDNPGAGVWADASGLSSQDQTISGNGGFGMMGYLGSTLVLNPGTIVQNNNGDGVQLHTNSIGQITGATIQFNAWGGIRLMLGSKLLIYGPPASTVGGNQGYGLECADAESSEWIGYSVDFNPPNTLGAISPSCTGF